MVGGNFAHFFDAGLASVFVLAWWRSHGVCKKDAAAGEWLPVCTGVGYCLSVRFEKGLGSPSADGAEDPSHCPKRVFGKLVASREVASGFFWCLLLTEKEPQGFFTEPVLCLPSKSIFKQSLVPG